MKYLTLIGAMANFVECSALQDTCLASVETLLTKDVVVENICSDHLIFHFVHFDPRLSTKVHR